MKTWTLYGASALLLIALAASGYANPPAIARGWLCAFVLTAMIPIGSLTLLLVHGISGGRWCRDLAPTLVGTARLVPWLLVAFLPIIVFRSTIYDWSAMKLPEDVRHIYLNPAFFDARTVAALAIWTTLVWTKAWRSELWSALGLAAHLVIMTFIPADWILTIAPGSTSAGFGLGFGIEQIFAALAFAAFLMTQGGDERANTDLAGLIVSSLLGTMYFLYMQYIITWYGNIPDRVHWYVVRANDGWAKIAFISFALGAAIPFLAILNPTVRHEPRPLRIVGASVLVGIALHVVWMIMPVFGAGTVVQAVLATAALAALLTSVSCTPRLRSA
jgi:hypothetical protein